MHPSVLRQFPIRRGSHPTRDDGLCAMEMVAWLAGEAHTDDPHCACPVIASYVRAFNDSLPSDSHRERYLRRLLPRLVNSRGDVGLRRQRAFRAADHGVRVLAPMLFEAVGDRAAANRLRALPPIQNRAQAKAAQDLAETLGAPRAVSWPLMMATRNHPATAWVPAVVQLVRQIGTHAGYEAATSLIREMLAMTVDTTSASKAKEVRCRPGRIRGHLGRLSS
jgi:hypothetical protein